MRCTVFLTLMALTACSNHVETSTVRSQPTSMSEYTFHQYASALTQQLLRNASANLHGGVVVVDEFTPVADGTSAISSDAAPQLGLQFQQSMQTLLSNAGFNVLSFSGAGSLISTGHDSIRVSEPTTYPATVKVDYVLSGTVTPQQHAYIVNSQLVDIATQHIVAAATAEIPLNVFWSRDQVQLRNGRLYRIDLQGAGQ